AQRFEDLVHDAEERLHAGPPEQCETYPATYASVIAGHDQSSSPDGLQTNLATLAAPVATTQVASCVNEIEMGEVAPSNARESAPHELDVPWLARIRPERRLLRGHKYALAKWCLDLSVVLLAMPIWLPLLGLCALAVKLESPH